MRLLLADDEKELSNALVAILKHSSYTVDAVYNGTDALDYALTGNYDGIILDIMMPGLDGTEVLKQLRDRGISTPVLFLTAKSEITDRINGTVKRLKKICRINGLDLGADDYLTKPFDMRELLARIRAMLRRKSDFSPVNLTCGNLTLDRNGYELFTPDHERIRLAGREFQMMEMLMDSPGRIVSVDTFMSHIWSDGEADVNVVWVNISNLRKKILSLDATCEIKACRGVGYSINEIK